MDYEKKSVETMVENRLIIKSTWQYFPYPDRKFNLVLFTKIKKANL